MSMRGGRQARSGREDPSGGHDQALITGLSWSAAPICFLHEHPAAAASWQEPCTVELLSQPEV
eukprot:15461845-Alexandrium_andersonii.AAC.1